MALEAPKGEPREEAVVCWMSSDARPQGLIQRYREELQVRHYARRTVQTDEQWLRRFLRFHGLRHPREMGSEDVNAFLSHLAVDLKVSHPPRTRPCRRCCFCFASCSNVI